MEKVVSIDKPAIFAFCFKPRGLEVPNKGSKHRSQKKISMSGKINSTLGEHDGCHSYGNLFMTLTILLRMFVFFLSWFTF